MKNKPFVNELYCNRDGIYSVYLMIKYFQYNKYPISALYVSDLEKNLEYECWGDNYKNGKKYNPKTVMNDESSRFAYDKKRINQSELKYPIIVCDGYVIDGMHRLAKAYSYKHTIINAYIINHDLLSKFLISVDLSDKGIKTVENYDQQYFDDLYNLKFNGSKWCNK
jgi:hypothetical protein